MKTTTIMGRELTAIPTAAGSVWHCDDDTGTALTLRHRPWDGPERAYALELALVDDDEDAGRRLAVGFGATPMAAQEALADELRAMMGLGPSSEAA